MGSSSSDQSLGEDTPYLDALMSTSMVKSQVKYGIESIGPVDISSSEQSQGELSPNQVKSIEMHATRVDITCGHNTIHLFSDEEGSIIVFPRMPIAASLTMIKSLINMMMRFSLLSAWKRIKLEEDMQLILLRT